ncbi:MAG: PAS domain S-box protein [Calditrichaeota bacterium]|nr:PAS domain S-box protein [Calditrichota bacterium]
MPTTPVDIFWTFLVGSIGLIGMAWVVIAITIRNQRKQLEAERERREVMQHSAHKYADLFNNVSDIIFIHSLSGEIQQVNDAVTRELGYDIREIIGQTIHDFLPAQYNTRLDTYLERIQTLGSSGGFVTIRAKDGEIKIFEYRNSLVREDNKAVAVRGIARNVTEHHVAERKLRQSEERYRRFFEEDLTGDFIATPSGEILAGNPAFANIFGFESVEQALQYNFASLYARRSDYEEYLRLLRKNTKLVYHEAELRRRDGEPVFVIENIIGTFNTAGELTQIRGYIFDNTERKRLEQQFLQAQKMQGIGTLAGGVAHDFNNILSIIMGHISMIEQGVLEAQETANSTQAIQQAVKRGAQLVEKILTFARKTDVIFQSVNVNAIIKELSTLLAGTFPKTVLFSVNLDPEIPYIRADQTQLHQALLNLCVNSRDAMPRGGRIAITTCTIPGKIVQKQFPEADPTKEYIQISVSDTGAGIEAETRTRLFEPFFTTKSRGQGTGLGLAVVYGVISSHYGFIDLESKVGHGTTFYLYFPEASEGVVAADHKVYPKTSQGSETILLVEDEDMLVDLLKSIFKANGYTIHIAKDGVQAVALYRQYHEEIDLVFTDSGLPKLGGWEAFCQMREINPKVKAVFASGYFEPGLKQTMLENGVKDFIQKPYSPMNVVHSIREVLDRLADS